MERREVKDARHYNNIELGGRVSVDKEYSVFGRLEEKRFFLLVLQIDL